MADFAVDSTLITVKAPIITFVFPGPVSGVRTVLAEARLALTQSETRRTKLD